MSEKKKKRKKRSSAVRQQGESGDTPHDPDKPKAGEPATSTVKVCLAHGQQEASSDAPHEPNRPQKGEPATSHVKVCLAHGQQEASSDAPHEPNRPQKGEPATSPVKVWTVYVIESTSGKLYTGITTDLERRFEEHASNSRKGARFFRTSSPKKIVYTENGMTRSEASRREAEIKQMSRADKLKLTAASIT